jgi:NDP-sugar pyrophosphorylase family protein
MVLAAGLGTRMRPLTALLAKPALPVLNRPLLHFTLEALSAAGVRHVAINTHHLPRTVRAAVGSGRRFGLRVHWSHERTVLGTGGGPRAVRRFLGDEPFLLVNGDVFFDFDLQALVRRRARTGAAAVLGLIPNPDPRRYSRVVRAADGRVVSIAGMPRASRGRAWLFAGVHLLDPALLDRLPPGPSESVRDLYAPMLAAGERVDGVALAGAWYDLGAPPLYLASQLALLDKRVVRTVRGSLVDPRARVHGTARVVRSVIGPGAVVGAGAVIEDSVIWERSTVGADAEVRGSVVAGAAVRAGASLRDSIVTPGRPARVWPLAEPAR